ncbi:DALR anticodon-binding domain-containing protein [Limnoraphis robusta]|uniref:DALR anticodon-binding domain-containing protein n=1 Tax=Limnoraphis robusta TaxID=1118279 RepID=UPI002B1F429D|nr:DALR anticodon-binding domain-containing protein [Limnoraphis robusta]MEA5500319.1 DALR anticodon-binding domain-containing protein [Limnoraphis robusta BA-68 BA1]
MMMTLSQKSAKTWLSIPEYPLEAIPSSAYIRCSLTTTVKNILEKCHNSVSTESANNQETLPDIELFFNSIQTSKQVYKASLSRQLAADLPPDIEQTSLKDEPKDWFIKTADFGDDCDRVLQHRDGEYTQLLEDIARYHQIFQQGYDKIILIRPTTYTGYDIQLTAAMQCLGYTKEQFQFIIVQPLKLYAFHKPTQQIHPISDLPPKELIKAIGMDALRWHSFSTPLTKVAPINLSTVGQLQSNDTFALVQFIYQRCLTLVRQGKDEGINPSMNWDDLKNLTWESTHAVKLLDLVEATPQILTESSRELAPHLICSHLENFSQLCQPWLEGLSLTPQNFQLLSTIEQTMLELLKILGIQR